MILFGSVDINLFGLWPLVFGFWFGFSCSATMQRSKIKDQRPKANDQRPKSLGVFSFFQQFLRMPSRIGCDFRAGDHSRQLFNSPLSFKPLRGDSSSILKHHFLHREVAISETSNLCLMCYA